MRSSRKTSSVVEKFKSSARAPEALFRQAQGVLRSRQSQRELVARQLYTRAAEEYPKSEWAPRALLARAEVEERMRGRVPDEAVGTAVPIALPTYRTIAERYPLQSEMALWRMSEMFEDLDRYPLQARALIDLATRFPMTTYDAYSKVPATSPKYRNAQKKMQDLAR